ncbi:MAG: replication initiator protein A [Planctomycetota bacterium]
MKMVHGGTDTTIEAKEGVVLLDEQARQMSLFGDIAEFEQGKDELNMAEYPLSLAGKSLSSRKSGDGSEITFCEHIRDKSTGKLVERQVTISSPPSLGLPTYYDEEVLFGILQITNYRRRQSGGGDGWPKQVSFTRYELCKLLGLKHGKSGYQRLFNSIKRLAKTSYQFEYSWFDNDDEAWRNSVIINFIQDVVWQEAKNGKYGRVTITWNDHVHESFEAGYLRNINYLEYRAMELPLAKALYRFLGKHFWRRPRLSFDLHTLAYEKLGLSRKYDTGQIKRALAPAIAKLEERGYIKPVDAKQRYEKVRVGVWKIHFEMGLPAEKLPGKTTIADVETTPLERRLVAEGVSKGVAAALVADMPGELIERKLDVLGWLDGQKQSPSSNRGAWLAKSIREEWQDPPEYKSPAEREEELRMRHRRRAQHQEREMAKQQAQAEYEQALSERRVVVTRFWESLDPEQQEQLKAEAIGTGPASKLRRDRWKIFVEMLLGERLEAAGKLAPLPPDPSRVA